MKPMHLTMMKSSIAKGGSLKKKDSKVRFIFIIACKELIEAELEEEMKLRGAEKS